MSGLLIDIWLLVGATGSIFVAFDIWSHLRATGHVREARWSLIGALSLLPIGTVLAAAVGNLFAVSAVLAVLVVSAVVFARHVTIKEELGLRPLVVAAIGLALATIGFFALVDGNLRHGGAEFDLDRTARELARTPRNDPRYGDLTIERESILTGPLSLARAEEAIGISLLVAGLVELGNGAVLAASRHYWNARQRTPSASSASREVVEPPRERPEPHPAGAERNTAISGHEEAHNGNNQEHSGNSDESGPRADKP